MLVAVISDSHNNIKSIEAVKEYISKAEVLLFLGDGEEDLKSITENFKGKVYAVKGNCDVSNKNPQEMIIEIMGKKIFMCHGHRYNVKYEYNSIYYKGREIEADIVLFGHSHLAMIEEDENMIIMNPGSISHGYGAISKTIGYIEIVENKPIRSYIKELKI